MACLKLSSKLPKPWLAKPSVHKITWEFCFAAAIWMDKRRAGPSAVEPLASSLEWKKIKLHTYHKFSFISSLTPFKFFFRYSLKRANSIIRNNSALTCTYWYNRSSRLCFVCCIGFRLLMSLQYSSISRSSLNSLDLIRIGSIVPSPITRTSSLKATRTARLFGYSFFNFSKFWSIANWRLLTGNRYFLSLVCF